MEDYTIDVIIILIFKLLFVLGFIYGIKFWLKKSKSIWPIIIYWVLGIFIVFVMITDLIRFLLTLTMYKEDSLTRDLDSIGTISSLIGLIIYIVIGIKYFKKKKKLL